MSVRATILAGAVLCTGCAASAVLTRSSGSTASRLAMIHEAYPHAAYANLVADGRVPDGAARVDRIDPPIGGGKAVALLRFDELLGVDGTPVPPGAHVHAARLTLSTRRAGGAARLHRMHQPWDEGATYAAAFGGDGVSLDDREAAAEGTLLFGGAFATTRTADVTADVQAWADGEANSGWVIVAEGPFGWTFHGPAANEPALRPQLEVLYRPLVETPAVAAGDVDATSVVLLAQATAPGPLTFRLFAAAGGAALQQATVGVDDVLVPAKVEMTGLTPGIAYVYEAVDAAGAAGSGRFRTPAAPNEYRGLRFGVTGDWRGELRPYPALFNAPERDLDFMAVLGDTIYADYPSPDVPLRQARTVEEFRRKHAEVYAEHLGVRTLADVRAATAWFATIDDHEVTDDFAGGAPPPSDERFEGDPAPRLNQTVLYANGLRAFHEYHPIREEFYGDTGDPRTAARPKLYRARRFGRDAAMFLLDTRSFRDPSIAPVGFGDVQRFFGDAFEPGRTMLGEVQLQDLMADLVAAEQDGVTWKFVMIPDPIQNFGPILGEDRVEGYSHERTRLLWFLHERGIRNVVFIAADIHCTVTNNLLYQEEFGAPQIETSMWEITTGAVAFAPPFGPLTVAVLRAIPLAGDLFWLVYRDKDRADMDEQVAWAMDLLLDRWGLTRIGLEDAPVRATLLEGSWVSLHAYGWTEFDVDPQTQWLTVTTYGLDWYDRDDVVERPFELLAMRPEVVSRFVVAAEAVGSSCAADFDGDGAVGLADLDRMLRGLGTAAGATRADGDTDGDGDVDDTDLAYLVQHFGRNCE